MDSGKPKLYVVNLSSETDKVSDEIGFRTIRTEGTKILLNDEEIFCRGISIHEETPYYSGRAYSRDHARTLLSWAKELGCNFVRLAHYPHNEEMVREAERMGFWYGRRFRCIGLFIGRIRIPIRMRNSSCVI